ncbi:hypothetical protein M431DRAFT_512754 [Trichoderma harzianum CBS 226.95]|uniref:BTB domain-containing protein n=1 Tax=Trichoderma harzianum CBS 226.95 TaxID=983964 RepID=A0A2T3ZXQ1_TRIHA|nr:hypothetical protein M431DRAFT_512754 [Trichoderma harzianum CBS 226.95]PTB49591.1 hypothetical protein M431DRAFT_512754 [Trichoderma harzianum CBS 226.95]
MDNKYESILASKPFKFVVGPKKKQFIMHEAAITRLSKTLDKLLNGGMKESKEHCVCWEDIDEKTFLRFGEWAYTGDYKPEEPEILLDASQIATSKTGAKKLKIIKLLSPAATSLASFKTQDETWHHCALVETYNQNVTCQSCRNVYFNTQCCSNCDARQYTTCSQCRAGSIKPAKKQTMIEKFNKNSAYASPTTPFTPRKNKESCEDYSEVFLSHARLYVLADKYDIKELRDLSAHKIWVTLKEFTLYPERMGDIIGLVRYSFQNTLEKDKLRTLLKDFCACTVEDLCKGEGFQDLICETPEFACELIMEMSTRLA